MIVLDGNTSESSMSGTCRRCLTDDSSQDTAEKQMGTGAHGLHWGGRGGTAEQTPPLP